MSDVCPRPGCGNHGTCNPATKNCDCLPGWTGVFCQKPPSSSVPCVIDKAFRDAHNGGDLDCGNWGQFGVCATNGTCSCGAVNPFFGDRCEQQCRNNDDCGGIRNDNSVIGKCNSMTGTCECGPGWSGPQCRTVSDTATCTSDGDCGWGGTLRGTCDTSTGTCDCQKAPSGVPLYSGVFCEKVVPAEGSPCSKDADCGSPQEKCVNNACYGGANSNSDVNLGDIVGQTIEGMFMTESGITALALFIGVPAMSKYLIGAPIQAAMKAKVEQEMGELITSDTLKEITIGEAMATKVATELFAKQAAEQTVEAGIEIATKTAVETLFSPFGAIMDILDVLMIVSMILDGFDVAGLNMEMNQSVLDALMLQFYGSINGEKGMTDIGFTLPRPYLPENTVQFRTQMKETAVQKKLLTDIDSYLGKLVVNSDGQIIEPAFYNEAAQKLNTERQNNSVYWNMSRQNNTVFKNLVSYGWVMWLLLAVVVLFLTVSIIFSLKYTNVKVSHSK